MSNLLQFVSGGPKSIQRTSVTIANGSSTGTATITSVATAKSDVSHLGSFGNVTDIRDFFATVALTNSTTVTASRHGTTGSLVVNVQVVEYY